MSAWSRLTHPLALLLAAWSAHVLAWGAWWTALAVAALPAPRGAWRRPLRPWRITAIVPAHDEAANIAKTVRSLCDAATGPAADCISGEVLVVADNCSDATAAIARAAGARLVERHDPTHRGKGFALEAAVHHLAASEAPPDAVIVVDADTTVSANLFAAVAGRFEAGAPAVQVHNAVVPGASEFVRLRRLQFALSQWTRPLGMARLGLGTTLKGNGMALRWDVARDLFGGSDIAEDAAMTLTLARRGLAVAFEPRAEVRSIMPGDYAAGRSQDERWEHGRARLARRSLASAADAARHRHPAATAAALDLAAPSLVVLTLAAAVSAAAAVTRTWRVLHLAAVAAVVVYVVVGLAAARTPWTDVAALRFVPRYLMYKSAVLSRFLLGSGTTMWHRTTR